MPNTASLAQANRPRPQPSKDSPSTSPRSFPSSNLRLTRLQISRVHLIRRIRRRPHARAFADIPPLQHIAPIPQRMHVDEVALHVVRLGMETRVFDPHLPHPPAS